MAKDTCEATITKRLAWLVESLVVSSHEFSFLLLCFRNNFKNHKYLLFYVSKNEKKRKQRKKREVYDGNKDRNIKEKIFVVFEIISKTK